MARLEASAVYFAFDDAGERTSRLSVALRKEAEARPAGLFRVRATLRPAGDHLIEVTPFVDSGKPRRMSVASTPVHSSDRLLYHKTTRREVYSTRLAAAGAAVDDVILFNERGEVTECTIGNLVLELDGRLVTPALACGLLPGVLRQQLLDEGTVVERVIRIEDLERCKRLSMINSLRGSVPIEPV
jgi:para-aminobenzoate synthetase/4-amino-4-deoxychorismate lyase